MPPIMQQLTLYLTYATDLPDILACLRVLPGHLVRALRQVQPHAILLQNSTKLGPLKGIGLSAWPPAKLSCPLMLVEPKPVGFA